LIIRVQIGLITNLAWMYLPPLVLAHHIVSFAPLAERVVITRAEIR
jgi:hypothetical protein